MYKVLKELRAHLGWTQEQLADELGVDTSQISKLERARSTRSFDILCGRLRKFVRAHPMEWVSLLASPDAGRVLKEYEDLLFLTPDTFTSPEAPPPSIKLVWKMAQSPLDCRNTQLRKIQSGMTQYGLDTVYWVPESALKDLRVTFSAMEFDDAVTPDQLAERIKVVVTPSSFALTPMSITDPLSDDRMGYLANDPDTAEVIRVHVLPRDATLKMAKHLEAIYRDLQRSGAHTDADGFTWRMLSVSEVMQVVAA